MIYEPEHILHDHVDPHCFLKPQCYDAVINAMKEYGDQFKPKVTELHNRIYLQVGDESEGEMKELTGVTWCKDKINETDIAYVLESETADATEKLKNEIEFLKREIAFMSLRSSRKEQQLEEENRKLSNEISYLEEKFGKRNI